MAVKSPEVEGHVLFVAARERRCSVATVKLGQAAYKVRYAHIDTRAELNELLQRQQPDALVLDLALAQTLGSEGVALLKRSASAPLVVIALAPPRTAEAEELALTLGADATLDLPCARPKRCCACAVCCACIAKPKPCAKRINSCAKRSSNAT